MNYNEGTPLSLTAGVDASAPKNSVVELPRQRLFSGAGFWIGFNLFQAISYASGLTAARKALHEDWQYVIAGLAGLGFIGLVLVLIRQIERLEGFVAGKSDGLGRIFHRCLLGVLLAACVAAPIVQFRAIKVADELRDARTSVTPCGASLCPR